MEAGAISPGVEKACDDDNYTSLVQWQNELPSSSRRGTPAHCGCIITAVAIHHHLGSGKSPSLPSNVFCRHGDPGTFSEGQLAPRRGACGLDPRESCVSRASKLNRE